MSYLFSVDGLEKNEKHVSISWKCLKKKKNAFASGVRINAIAKFDKMQDEN